MMVRQRSQKSPKTKTSQAISPSPQQTFQASEPLSITAPKNPNFQGLSSELSMPIQAKLTVGEPNDKYEQEADRVAAQVVQQIHAPVINQSADDAIQRKEASPDITPLKFSSLQRKTATEGNTVSSGLESSINQARGTGKPLPNSLRPKMENAFGSDLGNVRIHDGARADQLSRSIQARAFTTGQDIFFRGGAYKPDSYSGQQLIAHELTHVAQQQTQTQLVQRDFVEDAALKGRNKRQLKRDLASCIGKFKEAIRLARETADDEEALAELNEGLATKGRDAFFYRRIWWKNKHGIEGDLNRWKQSWSVARTGGLLADLGLVLKNVPLNSFTGVDFDDIANDYLQTGSHHVRKRVDEDTGELIAPRSDWYDDMMRSGLKINAGPSSTSTQLLLVAASIGTFEHEEVEAMMVALVTFWKGWLKRKVGGGHHTAVEVWAPYTGYLKSQQEQE